MALVNVSTFVQEFRGLVRLCFTNFRLRHSTKVNCAQDEVKNRVSIFVGITATTALLCSSAAAAPLVTFESPCECQDNKGKHRWSEKNDPALPPTDASTIQAVTPSDIFNWQGPTEYLVPSSPRLWSEEKWYALTGRVVELRAEEDGDLHIALQDATGAKPGFVVVEIPAKPQRCALRKIVFGWTEVQFPFRVRSGRKLKLTQPLVITVIGKAFFDIGHAPADHSNRRTDLQDYAAWEIHPVIKLEVTQ